MAQPQEEFEKLAAIKLSDFLKTIFCDSDKFGSNYFDYTEYMWSLKDNPEILLVFYEDIILVGFSPFLHNLLQHEFYIIVVILFIPNN